MDEALLILMTLAGFTSMLVMMRLGREWLYASIIANLLFISIFGAKLITVFGVVTNVGNVFYAVVFFVLYILVEHYSAEEANRAVWVGFFGVLLFIVSSQFIIGFTGTPESMEANHAIEVLYGVVPRIAIASLFAYLITQHLNIWFYDKLRREHNGAWMWLRVSVCVLLFQIIDSVLFFTVAFLGVLPFSELAQVMIVGYIVKVTAGIASIPFMYLSFWVKKL